MFELQKSTLEFQKSTLKDAPGELLGKYDSEIARLDKSIHRYDEEKITIKRDAEDLEKNRDLYKLHSSEFGFAVIFLQVSILLSSIAALTKKKYIWLVSIAVGSVGIFYFANGFLLFF